MSHLKSIDLPNGCIFIIGQIELIRFPMKQKKGQINLETYSTAGISGLNTYYSLKRSIPSYVRVHEIPDFEE